MIIFTCMTTRAIHLELVTDKSTDFLVSRGDCVRGALVRLFVGFCRVFLYKVQIVIGFGLVVVGCFIGFDEDMLVLSFRVYQRKDQSRKTVPKYR